MPELDGWSPPKAVNSWQCTFDDSSTPTTADRVPEDFFKDAVPPISNLREDRRAEFGSPSDMIVSEPLDAVVFCTGYDDT